MEFWTLTLGRVSYSDDEIFYIEYDGSMLPLSVDMSLIIRPVIVLNSNVEVSGIGTKTNPYVIN